VNDLNKKASTCKASTSFSGSQKLIFDSSGEESSDEEQNVVISGITTSTEHDAAGHNSKGDGERLGISLIFNHIYFINYSFRNSINIYFFQTITVLYQPSQVMVLYHGNSTTFWYWHACRNLDEKSSFPSLNNERTSFRL
jgi:hypothetical protein